ncbi:MAG: hypothetical protein ACOCZX_01730 [Candidatus Bipolaricaulota bacterium]
MQNKTLLLLVSATLILALLGGSIWAVAQEEAASSETANETTDLSVSSTIMVILVTALAVGGVIGYAWITKRPE